MKFMTGFGGGCCNQTPSTQPASIPLQRAHYLYQHQSTLLAIVWLSWPKEKTTTTNNANQLQYLIMDKNFVPDIENSCKISTKERLNRQKPNTMIAIMIIRMWMMMMMIITIFQPTKINV